MAYKKQNEGETCNQCGEGKIVRNPNKGTVFCEDKCWLQGGQAKPQARQQSQSVDWEAKDRLSAGQTAINAGSTTHEGSGDDEKVLKSAIKYYNFLRQAKAGIIPSPEPSVDVNDDVGEGDIPF